MILKAGKERQRREVRGRPSFVSIFHFCYICPFCGWFPFVPLIEIGEPVNGEILICASVNLPFKVKSILGISRSETVDEERRLKVDKV